MNRNLTLAKRTLTRLLEPMGFTCGNQFVFRLWNSAGDICCTVAFKVLSGSQFSTVEIGFVSPQILMWSGIECSDSPLPYEADGVGIFFRLEDLGIRDGFVFPPGGWRISSTEDRESFENLLETRFVPKLASLLKEFLDWSGWVSFFQEEIRRFPCGRGRAWALLGYSLLASPNRTVSEIQAVIEAHSRQDGSKRVGNRVDADIVRQQELLRERVRQEERDIGCHRAIP